MYGDVQREVTTTVGVGVRGRLRESFTERERGASVCAPDVVRYTRKACRTKSYR